MLLRQIECFRQSPDHVVVLIRHGTKALRLEGLQNFFILQVHESIADLSLELRIQVASHRPRILRIRLRDLENLYLVEADDTALHERFEDISTFW